MILSGLETFTTRPATSTSTRSRYAPRTRQGGTTMAEATTSRYGRDEIEAAWAEYQRRGVGEHDWPGWADMFTDDARYEEHFLGVFEGRPAISKFIVDVMKEYPAMT